jgi:hypothetical protein
MFILSSMNLSRFNLTGCDFRCYFHPNIPKKDTISLYSTNFKDVDLTDTVITKCSFEETRNLTAEQIKSTWNYKNKRMDSVTLPEHLCKELGHINPQIKRVLVFRSPRKFIKINHLSRK